MDGISNVNAYIKNQDAAQKMAEKLSGTKKTSSGENKAANNARLEGIRGKMRRGKKLSCSDKAFLRKSSPQLLQKAVAAERKRAQIEQKLKSCKSKDEFYRLRAQVTQTAADPSLSGSAAASCTGIGEATDNAAFTQSAPAGAAQVSSAQTTAVAQTTTVAQTTSVAQTAAPSAPAVPDNGVNYAYRAADDAYRSFKQGMKFTRLPQTLHRAQGKRFSVQA